MNKAKTLFSASALTRSVATTTYMEELAEAVYGDNIVAHIYAASNPLLTEDLVRHLFPLLKGRIEIYKLMKNTNFPADLLHQLAIEEEDDLHCLNTILESPNVSEETRVIIALKINT